MSSIKASLLGLACISALALVPPVSASVVYQNDFNATPLGSGPADWFNRTSVPTTHPVTLDPFDSAGRVLSTPGGTNRTSGAYHSLPAAVAAPVGLKLSFDLYTAEARDTNWNARWYLESGAKDDFGRFTPGYGIQLGATSVRIHKTSGGGNSASPGTAATLVTTNLAPGTYTTVYGWTHVEFEWFSDGTLVLSLNGRRVSSFKDSAPLPLTFRTLGTISFLNNNASSGTIFTGALLRYDNVVVSQILRRETFATLAVGANPPDWFSTTGNVTGHKGALDPLSSANPVLSTPGGVARTTGAFTTLPSAVTVGEGLKFSASVYVAAAGDANWNTRWYLESGDIGSATWFTPGYGFQLAATTAKIQKLDGGGTAGDPGSATTLVTANLAPGAYTANGWTRVDFEWAPDGTLRLFLNGTLVAYYKDTAPLPPVFRTLATVSFLNNNASNGPVFTDGVLYYDDLTVSVLGAQKEDIYWLVWDATSPDSALSSDAELRAHALAATEALADKLSVIAPGYGEISVLLECINQWWVTGTATSAQLEDWLADARASVELHYAAGGGATEAAWTTVDFVLGLLTEEILGGPAAGVHPTLPEPVSLVPSRFAAVPAAGVHPRVLISAAELPVVRSRLVTTASGVKARANMTNFLDQAIGAPGSTKPLRAAYDRLVAGDLTAMTAVTTADAWWKGQMNYVVCFEAFLALIDTDAARGATVAAALDTYARISQARALDGTNALDEYVGYAYDFAYDFMTTAQRGTVRGVIATATSGQLSYGTNLPASHRSNNLFPHGMILPLLALAIEGETGYDSTIYPRSVQILGDFLTYGIDAQGAPVEDMHYLNFGMAKGAQAMVAMVKRGDNLFTAPHYRKLHNWLVHAMEPYGREFSTHDDTPADDGGLLPNYTVMKWVWPDDPVMNYVWKNRIQPNYSGGAYRGDMLTMALFPSDWSGTDSAPTAGVADLGLPLSWLGDERRLFIARDRWAADALAVHVESNPALKGPGHQHSNSGDFTLSALGRKWAIDRGFHIGESKDHSVVLVDGQGQGYFAAPSRLVEAVDDGDVAFSSVDSRYPYAWAYTFKSRIGTDARWEPEMLMGVREYYELAAAAAYKEAPWTSPALTSYTYKRVYNPMEKAFRTVVLRRAELPYVLVVDDIKKDSLTHTYEWLMQVPDDLEIKQSATGEVVLGAIGTADDRRLLVRMLEPGAGAWQLETYAIANSPETGNSETFGEGKRLKFTVQSVEPKFKVLLFPHRVGDALPTTSISASPAVLSVAWTGQEDHYSLESLAGGRTGLSRQTPATVALGGLSQTFDGSPKAATVTTAPEGLPVSVTYNGGTAAPANAGTYAITATIVDPNYWGATSGVLTIDPASAVVTLGGLRQAYDGTPKSATATTQPAGLPVTFSYDGGEEPPILPGPHAVAATINDANYSGSTTGTLVLTTAALVRHAPSLNGGLDGSAQVLLPESVTLNGTAWLSGDLLMPGTPALQLNGQPTYAGVLDAGGDPLPQAHQVTLNSNAVMRYLVRRTDPLSLEPVAAPSAPAGTRVVVLDSPGESAGDFATLRDLTLNSTAGAVAVPPGAYGNLTANSGCALVFGVAEATEPAVYQLQNLTLNGNASLQLAGPVVLTLANALTIQGGTVGSAGHPEWLSLRVHAGGVTLNSGATFHGHMVAPAGAVTINAGATLNGSVVSDALTINTDGLLNHAGG